jgi:hypothetical protein
MRASAVHCCCSLQPSQLWGVLWGLSQMGHLPPPAWMASWLAAARQQLDKFDAEGLAHAAWALAALGHVPDKLWLRAFAGMVAHRVRYGPLLLDACMAPLTCAQYVCML